MQPQRNVPTAGRHILQLSYLPVISCLLLIVFIQDPSAFKPLEYLYNAMKSNDLSYYIGVSHKIYMIG